MVWVYKQLAIIKFIFLHYSIQVLKRPEYFGKFGKIHKVVINNSTSYAGSQVRHCSVTLGKRSKFNISVECKELCVGIPLLIFF